MCPWLNIIHTRIQAHLGTRQRKTPSEKKGKETEKKETTKHLKRLSVDIISARNNLVKGDGTSLQDSALALLLACLGQKGSAGSSFENLTDTFIGPGRAFEVLVGADLLADFLTLDDKERTYQWPAPKVGESHLSTYLVGRDGLLGGLVQLFIGLRVVTKIHLAANKDDGQALAEMEDLGNPLKE